MQTRKSLGQHWLKDKAALKAICETAGLSKNDTILEIGPGQGDLTRQLVGKAGKVIAVEIDSDLAGRLSKEVVTGNFTVINTDILKFDLSQLSKGYKVVANIPYYLTSILLRILSESVNPPQKMILLVQKEVAERICAGPGRMNLLAASVQLYYEPRLGPAVPAKLFTPPPKVDSQVIILDRRAKPLFEALDSDIFFRLVKAGFAGRRKKLRSSLAAGLGIDKSQADKLLKKAGINANLRAQELSLQDWHKLYKVFKRDII